MGIIGPRGLRGGVAIVLATALVGCAARGAPPRSLPRAVRAEVGRLGVVAVGTPALSVWTPNTVKSGARDGAKAAAQFLVSSPYTFLLGVAFYGAGFVAIPLVGAGIGSAVGAAKAPPRREVRAAERALERAVAETRFAEIVRDRVVRGVRERAPHVVVEPLGGPAEATARDAILELDVTEIEASGPWGTDQRGAVIATVEIRLTRGGTRVYDRRFEYAGGSRGIATTPESLDEPDDARAFREDLRRAAQALADDVARALFPPPEDEVAVLTWESGATVLAVDGLAPPEGAPVRVPPGRHTIRYQGSYGEGALEGSPARVLGPRTAVVDLEMGQAYVAKAQRVGDRASPQLYLWLENVATGRVVDGQRPRPASGSPATATGSPHCRSFGACDDLYGDPSRGLVPPAPARTP